MTKEKFKRAAPPPPMRFQERDGQILSTIHQYDGVLSRRQIKAMFWPHASVQAMERRLSLLFHNSFLDWPDPDQRRTKPIPEPVVWLGWRGIMHVAQQICFEVQPPSTGRENQLRLFDKRLRTQGIRWQREPRWSQLAHDIAVNDFRMIVEQAAKKWPSLTLEKWLPEGDFFSDMDVITIQYTNPKGENKSRRKGIRPDGFFILVDHLRQINNSSARGRFLLEFDNGNHPLDRFGREKALPGLQYLRSEAYKNRFGFNSGRWLVVCNSKQRLQNLKFQTEKMVGKDAWIFLFTTMDQVKPDTVLNAPIWFPGGAKKVERLIKTFSVGQ
jgi:hypothetical protein